MKIKTKWFKSSDQSKMKAFTSTEDQNKST